MSVWKRGRGQRKRQKKSSLLSFLSTYLFLAIVLTAGIAYVYRTLRAHPSFAIDTLSITGASRKTEADLRERLDWIHGENFFLLDLARVRTQVEDHKWVDGVSVRALLPRTLRLLVNERAPAGLIRIRDEVLIVGENRETIASFDNYEGAPDFPILIGLDKKQDLKAAISRGLETLKIIKETSLLFWDHIETLDLSDEENMIVHLRSVAAPIYLGREVIPTNINNYLSFAHRIEREYPQLYYIELGFPSQIAILPKEVEE